MREEYREYKTGRAVRKNANKKSFGYLKKLFRQTVFSIIIFSVIVSPEFFGISSGKYIKSIAKEALLYTIDTSGISKLFKDFYSNSIHKGEKTNEEINADSKNI